MVADGFLKPPPSKELVEEYDDLEWRVNFLLELLKDRKYDKKAWRDAVIDAVSRIHNKTKEPVTWQPG